MSIEWISDSNLGNFIERTDISADIQASSDNENPVHYGIIYQDDDHENLPIEKLTLNKETGVISGFLNKLDLYVNEFIYPGENGPPKLSDGNPVSSIPYMFSFTVRAIEDIDNTFNFENPPAEYSDRTFTLGVFHNWDPE